MAKVLAPANSFIGRRKELRELLELCTRNQPTQVLITGLGGRGKTSLALRLAQCLEEQGFSPFHHKPPL